MKNSTSPLSRSILGLCGLAVGSYCALTAFENGRSLSHDDTIRLGIGIAFAAVAVGSWFLLPIADAWSRAKCHGTAAFLVVSWALCLCFIIANAVMFTAGVRTEHVNEKTITIADYNRAEENRVTARADLASLKGDELWTLTHECANATRERSIRYCDKVAAAQGALTRAEHTLQGGRPAEPDAGATTLAWAIGSDTATVARAFPVAVAAVLELMASLFMKFAFKVPGRKVRQQDALSRQFTAWNRAARAKPAPRLRIIDADAAPAPVLKALEAPKEKVLPKPKTAKKTAGKTKKAAVAVA